QERNAALQERLSQAIVLDKDKQKEFASVAQAVGVGLPTCRTLLEVLLGKRAPKVSTLGRWTKAAGKKAGELLAVLDEFTYDRVKQAVADEIYTKHSGCGFGSEQRGGGFESAASRTGIDAGRGSTGSFPHVT